jgi:hypothetical protein
MVTGTGIFIDTSTQIARKVHSRGTKAKIEARLACCSISVTGEVVKQEFKRRLLKEAKYLLETLAKQGSFAEMYHHVVRLPPQMSRKRNICLAMLGQLFDQADDRELTERFRLYLHYLLTLGLDQFDASVGQVIRSVGCACARVSIVEKVRYKRYEFGPDKCSNPKAEACGIVAFLQQRTEALQGILQRLQSLPVEEKSTELQQAEEFITHVLQDPRSAVALDPCYCVGDLIIALESAGIPIFYTLNGKESQHLCRALDQTLIVRPTNPQFEDVECPRADPHWQKF